MDPIVMRHMMETTFRAGQLLGDVSPNNLITHINNMYQMYKTEYQQELLNALPIQVPHVQDKFSVKMLEFLDSDYSEDRDELMGRGGTRTFRFQTKSPGTQHIQLGYRRPWEDVAVEHFDVNIRVQ